jgi:hypothetical protein
MENALPDTYLIGQPLKANTFGEQQQPDVGASLLVFTPLLSMANEESSRTMAEQEESSKRLKAYDFVYPPPTGGVVGSEPVARLNPRQAWEGTVIECLGSSFLARVTDRTNPSNPDELVTFDLDEISEEDRKMVEKGSSFYWTIGTERSPAGQIKNVDMVNFRRLPGWKASSFREADREAQDAIRLLL